MEDAKCDASSVSDMPEHSCQNAMVILDNAWATDKATFPQWLQAILPGTRLVSYIDVHHMCKSASQCQQFTISFHNRTTVAQEVIITYNNIKPRQSSQTNPGKQT